MNVTSATGPDHRLQSFTVTLEPEDDPVTTLTALVTGHDRLLELLLARWSQPHPYSPPLPGDPRSREDALQQLTRFAYLARVLQHRLGEDLVAARDIWGASWGELADATLLARSTVRGRVAAARDDLAELGFWYDQSGLNSGTPSAAGKRAGEAARQDGAEPAWPAGEVMHMLDGALARMAAGGPASPVSGDNEKPEGARNPVPDPVSGCSRPEARRD